ncbi:hypothetical protein QTP88_005339 [Uroleucon formosanum]
MSTNRKLLSGDQYKKIAKLKSEKLHDVLNKTYKLTDFFKNPASTSGSCSNSNTNTIDILKKTDAQVMDNIEPEGRCGSNELTNMIVNETIFETDPVKWVINDEFCDYVAKNGFNQNKTNGFINSKRVYCDKTRYLTNIMFNRRLINGEIIVRSWLVYPLSLGVVFCEPCRIFQTSLETQLVTEGFNNWKNAISRFSYYENSKEHRDAIINLKHRGNILGRIDYSLIKQLDTEIEY